MSKFLRKMNAMSLRPEDFRPAAHALSIGADTPPATVVGAEATTVVTNQTTTVVFDIWRADLNGALFPPRGFIVLRELRMRSHMRKNACMTFCGDLRTPTGTNAD